MPFYAGDNAESRSTAIRQIADRDSFCTERSEPRAAQASSWLQAISWARTLVDTQTAASIPCCKRTARRLGNSRDTSSSDAPVMSPGPHDVLQLRQGRLFDGLGRRSDWQIHSSPFQRRSEQTLEAHSSDPPSSSRRLIDNARALSTMCFIVDVLWCS
jgi:hypothetical protein